MKILNDLDRSYNHFLPTVNNTIYSKNNENKNIAYTV
jgi:hypothetical protein